MKLPTKRTELYFWWHILESFGMLPKPVNVGDILNLLAYAKVRRQDG